MALIVKAWDDDDDVGVRYQNARISYDEEFTDEYLIKLSKLSFRYISLCRCIGTGFSNSSYIHSFIYTASG